MELCNPKGGRTAALAFPAMPLLMMIMMLLNAYCCSAAVVAKSNTSFLCSNGRLDECLMEEDLELELELGFLINPYVSRILARHDQGQKPQSNKRGTAAFPKSCGNPWDPQYDSCIAKLKPDNTKCVCRGLYCRGCKPLVKFESWN